MKRVVDSRFDGKNLNIPLANRGQLCRDKSGNLSVKYIYKPYWLKYFFLMGKAEREVVKLWLDSVAPQTEKQAAFLQIVKEAVKSIDYDYRISVIEPSINSWGELFFRSGEKVARSLRCFEWKSKSEMLFPAWGSDLADLDELFLWYAYRIAKNLWSIEYVCDDSSDSGNYRNSTGTSHDFEVSDMRRVGGFADGVGNTYKIVTYHDGFVACGGDCDNYGSDYPVSDVSYYDNPNYTLSNGSGVIVLRDGVE